MTDYDPYSGKPRKQVPPGTRDARTGDYIRKPIPVKGGGGGGGGQKSTCVCMVMTIGLGLGAVAVDGLHRYVDLMAVLL